MKKMKDLKRVVEMYVGWGFHGIDSGTWETEYVEIPRDTPECQVRERAIAQAKEDFSDFVFVGIYSIPDLNESDEMIEYDETIINN